ncbi:MAG: HAD family hydrolase [Deltaproteobacteria bacterium]|nr:HAD family hydrolase [Deltaproteobacteria bacterium]
MVIIFDIMGTVLGALDRSPRPGIRETVDSLRESGNTVAFWTSGNVEDYRAFMKFAGIEGDVYSKTGALPFRRMSALTTSRSHGCPRRLTRSAPISRRNFRGNPYW